MKMKKNLKSFRTVKGREHTGLYLTSVSEILSSELLFLSQVQCHPRYYIKHIKLQVYTALNGELKF
jgi:hypothetical protein